MASITIKNLSKHYGKRAALDDLSLAIEDREFVVMVGPTGAGKTTTLRCLAGLEKPSAGQVFFDERDVTKVSPAGRDVAFVFQSYALYPRKSVHENIAFPLRARGLNADQRAQEVQRVARLLRISHLLERRPVQLSGGEQQRVALGRAMVRQPHAFLMDEPLTNLDFQLRNQMRTELKRIQQELNRTFFYVTNDQIEALSLGDRVAVLNQGVLQQVGPPQEIYEHPANLFVARFIGSTRMNFLPCAYEAATGQLIGQDRTWTLPAPDRMRACAQNSRDAGRLILGVRPEDVKLQPVQSSANGRANGDSNDSDDIVGRIYVIEPLGDRNIYDVKLGDALLKVKTPANYLLDAASSVSIHFNMARAHLFDAVTEQSLSI